MTPSTAAAGIMIQTARGARSVATRSRERLVTVAPGGARRIDSSVLRANTTHS